VAEEIRNLVSLGYWRAPPERVPQRFYVAFCLLMSSLQDAILGQKERQWHNLNWSATCSYYSLVHGGRLLCFLALGNYPQSHIELRRIFSPRLLPGAERRVRLNWLSGFADRADGRRGQALPGSLERSPGEFRQIIDVYLEQIQVPEAEPRLARFGAILAATAPLRNDSNYEALIAHEYEHFTMSAAFAELSRHMAGAAESTLPLFIDAFNGFLRDDPDLSAERDAYDHFLQDYMHVRIGNAIRHKIHDAPLLETKLNEILMRIGTRFTETRYDHLENQVSMAVFGNKARLMREFEAGIENLARVAVV